MLSKRKTRYKQTPFSDIQMVGILLLANIYLFHASILLLKISVTLTLTLTLEGQSMSNLTMPLDSPYRVSY